MSSFLDRIGFLRQVGRPNVALVSMPTNIQHTTKDNDANAWCEATLTY